MDLNINDGNSDTYIPLPTAVTRLSLEKHIFSKLIRKHHINEMFYNINVITDIIYNEKTHTVAKFKDYLILDDLSEFLKRYYTIVESAIRLPRFLEYYDTYSRIFPNYTSLPESKFIYKNIHKKQKMIDQQQNFEQSAKMNTKYKGVKQAEKYDNQVFSTEVCNSIANDSSYMNYLFGLKGNNNSFKKHNKDKYGKYGDSKYNNNNKNVVIDVEESINNINKIISVIDEIEQKQNEDIKHNMKHNYNSNNINNVSQKDKNEKPKRPALIINHKQPFPKTNNINKHVSTLSKDINNMNKSSNFYKDLNMFNDFRLNFEKHIDLSHRGSFFSSSYSNRKNPNSNNSSKNKNNQSNTNNTNSTNFPITNSTIHKPSKDFDKIRLNMNFNNTPNYMSSNRSSRVKSPGTSEKIKHKIKDILIKNLNLNNNSHHRNHNCLLNSKGQIFNSKTNNNSVSNNTNSSIKNSTIHYTSINKQQLLPKSTKNAQINNNNNNNENIQNNNVNNMIDSNNNVVPSKIKKMNSNNIHTSRSDNNSKCNFDFNLLKKFISKSISQSKSKSKQKCKEKTKHYIKGTYANFAKNNINNITNNNTRKINSNNIINNNKEKNLVNQPNQMKVNKVTTNANVNTKVLSPPHKSNKIPGIQIKGFNKVLEYQGRNKGEYKNGTNSNSQRNGANNNNEWKSYQTSTSKTTRVNQKYKI